MRLAEFSNVVLKLPVAYRERESVNRNTKTTTPCVCNIIAAAIVLENLFESRGHSKHDAVDRRRVTKAVEVWQRDVRDLLWLLQ